MRRGERVADNFRGFRGELKQALRDQLGLKRIPPQLASRLNLLEERANARAKLGKNQSSLEKFRSDVRLMRRHGWMTDTEARQALRWAHSARKDDVSHKGLRSLTANYFDRDYMASHSVAYVNLALPR